LIDDLLNLSQVTRSEMNLGLVNLSLLASNLCTELQHSHPEHQVELVIEPGLVAQGDARLLQILLMNLLNNAWKFSAKHPHPHVEFGGLSADFPEPVYFVRDNGQGFDMAFANKLFGPFQRLHSAAEFPGNGIGLATVQRITHRHGGKVWAESVLGQGATFYFTLQPEGAPEETQS
jgi:light-regulated signal transduction histidine kinase (bacteriophytochrome)